MQAPDLAAGSNMIQPTLDSLMITGFVSGTMLLIETVNVLSGGRWIRLLTGRRYRQYLLAAMLGGIPGCLGAFTAVALYSHGAISFGSVVAAMIASSGDEAFVMLALAPGSALAIAAILIALALPAAWMTDWAAGKGAVVWPRCEGMVIHEAEELRWPSLGRVVAQWRDCSAARGSMSVALALFAAATAAGRIGPPEWNWMRISLLAVSAGALLVVASAPEHFLEEHLWRHVARKHAPRVFLWTLTALVLSGPLAKWLSAGDSGQGSKWLLLPLACVVGLIPESGPHLVFVTLYVQGAIPFGILLASSV
ncbi:MAG: putative manganese transporter, partial [Bryobacter sp.]|nr:putative manganese transporter [Bryobacter sp.]